MKAEAEKSDLDERPDSEGYGTKKFGDGLLRWYLLHSENMYAA